MNDAFTPLDARFADLLVELAGKPSAGLHYAARLVSRNTSRGHVCLDLSHIDAGSTEAPEGAVSLSIEEWSQGLLGSGVVGKPGETAPLILDPPLLYLQRYYQYEKDVAQFFLARRSRKDLADMDPYAVGTALRRLFPQRAGDDGLNWQQIAALVAVSGEVSIISGGPGTGKTTTVAGILALCLEMESRKDVRIMLAAPTGKAAARLQDAFDEARDRLDCSDSVKERMTAQAMTVHRLLGRERAGYRYNRENPLPADLVVIDEASMVDLPLMSRLVEALSEDCRLILLGDRNQLASVQPGSVLGDLCQGDVSGFSGIFRSFAARAGIMDLPAENGGPLADALVELKQSFRFTEESGIFEVSRAVKEGDGEKALSLLRDESYPDVQWRDFEDLSEAFSSELLARISKHMKQVLAASCPGEALSIMGRFAVLCALRHGRLGADTMNKTATQSFIGGRLRSPGDFYHGRPVIVTRNHHERQLYNGDTGICWRERDQKSILKVYFPAGAAVRKFLPQQLPNHETSYALTVHKSQGSEFDHVLLVLPDAPSPVVTSELIYTALTRARKSVEVWGRASVFKEAVSTRIVRTSGLNRALSG